jgi:Fe-S-cluster-containing hydrogenase component 2
MYASRNVARCNKDCVCLFVCPTGATNTETGQIDRETCVEGCRACVDACPSHAISLVMERYPEPRSKSADLACSLLTLCERKVNEEGTALSLADAQDNGSSATARVARALAKSARILAEDCAREAGYMIPQSEATRATLDEMAARGGDAGGVARELADRLRAIVPGTQRA